MPLIDYGSLFAQGSLFLVFILMISNGFFSFPSSQILYITLGVFVASGKIGFIPMLIVGALGNTIGNYLLYEITHRHGEKVARQFLPIKAEMYEALKETFKEKSLLWLALGKMTPSLKVIIPLLAGIARTKRIPTFFVFLITSFIWGNAFISIGVFFGKSFSFGYYGLVMGALGLGIALYFTSLMQKKIEEMKKNKIAP